MPLDRFVQLVPGDDACHVVFLGLNSPFQFEHFLPTRLPSGITNQMFIKMSGSGALSSSRRALTWVPSPHCIDFALTPSQSIRPALSC